MIFHVPQGVLRAQVDGQEVLLNPATGVYHLVNETGRIVLAELDASGSIDRALEVLATRTDKPSSEIQRDVDDFISAMVARGLLESGP